MPSKMPSVWLVLHKHFLRREKKGKKEGGKTGRKEGGVSGSQLKSRRRTEGNVIKIISGHEELLV